MRRTAVITLALSATLGLAACVGGGDPMDTDTGGDNQDLHCQR